MSTHRSPSTPSSPPRRRWRSLLLACALLLPVASAGAQLDELRVGTRARLRAPGVLAGEAEGVVLARRADTLRFALRGGVPVPVPVDAITTASVYRGQGRAAGARRGAWRGALVGLGLGLFNVGFSDCSGAHCGAGERTIGVSVFTLAGAGAGSVIGASMRAEAWERLWVAPRPTAVVAGPTPLPW